MFDGANPFHPLNRFCTGTKGTLYNIPLQRGVDPKAALQTFFDTHYRPDLMTLSVYSNHSLDDLELLVKCFEAVPVRSGAVAMPTKGKPFIDKDSASLLEIVPVSEERSMELSWPVHIPNCSYRIELQRFQPYALLTDLLGHEGPGTLHSVLVDKKWINELAAVISMDLSDLEMLTLSIDLTAEGLTNFREIIAHVFAYIHLIQTHLDANTLPLHLIELVRKQYAVGYAFAERSNPIDYVTWIARNMQQYALADYLVGDKLLEQYHVDVMRGYVANLSPEALRVTLTSTAFAGQTAEVAPIYGTEFNNKTLAEETKTWKAIKHSDYPGLSLPQENELVADDFSLSHSTMLDAEQRSAALAEEPVVLLDTDLWKLYYKADRAFGMPKVYLLITLAIDQELFTEAFTLKARLFAKCFTDHINEYLYKAHMAGLDFEIDFMAKGLQFTISGFHDKYLQFVQTIFSSLSSFRVDSEDFSRQYDIIQRDLNSWDMQQPCVHSAHYAGLALESLTFGRDALRESLQTIVLEDVNSFLSSCLQLSFGTALISGSINEQDSKEVIAIVQQALQFSPLPAQKRSHRRLGLLPVADTMCVDGEHHFAADDVSAVHHRSAGFLLSHAGLNAEDENSAVTVHFQLPSYHPSSYVYLELLQDMLEQAFYHDLRTQQQLGYIVQSAVQPKDFIQTLVFTVQSPVLPADQLTARINTFINFALDEIIEELTEEELEEYKNSLLMRKREPPLRLTDHTANLWMEIALDSGFADRLAQAASPASSAAMVELFGEPPMLSLPFFQRRTTEVSTIQIVTLGTLKAFAKALLSPDGCLRRVLVSEVTSQKHSALHRPDELNELGMSTHLTPIVTEKEFFQSLRVL